MICLLRAGGGRFFESAPSCDVVFRAHLELNTFKCPNLGVILDTLQPLSHSLYNGGGSRSIQENVTSLNHQQGASYRTPPLIPQSSSSLEPKDLDLDLQSLWFAQTPARFPPKTIKPNEITYAATSGWSSSGVRKTHTYSIHMRFYKDLSSTKIHLTWDSSNPSVTVKAQQKHFPPPRKLSRGELEGYRQQYGIVALYFINTLTLNRYSDTLANWCESKMGQQVGNGECWTLAREGLEAIGAMPSQMLIHGALVYSCLPAQSSNPQPQGSILDAGVARGDVIQILKAHFQLKNGGSAWAGDPDHTAVITSVEPNGVLKVVEQNVGGVKKVKTGSYDMSTMVTGELRIYRAVSESWAGKLDPNW